MAYALRYLVIRIYLFSHTVYFLIRYCELGNRGFSEAKVFLLRRENVYFVAAGEWIGYLYSSPFSRGTEQSGVAIFFVVGLFKLCCTCDDWNPVWVFINLFIFSSYNYCLLRVTWDLLFSIIVLFSLATLFHFIATSQIATQFTRNTLRYPLLNSNIELYSRTKKMSS